MLGSKLGLWCIILLFSFHNDYDFTDEEQGKTKMPKVIQLLSGAEILIIGAPK